MIPAHLWVFRARCARVVDGDTLDLVVDQGLHTARSERVRLLHVNCPEVKGVTRAAGDAATAYTRTWLGVQPLESWPLIIQTEKDDAFGRWLALIWRLADGRCLNDDLLAADHAVPYHR